MRFRDEFDKETAYNFVKSRKKSDEDEEDMSRTQKVHTHRDRKWREYESKIKKMAITFL
jgi:hypothetical protein